VWYQILSNGGQEYSGNKVYHYFGVRVVRAITTSTDLTIYKSTKYGYEDTGIFLDESDFPNNFDCCGTSLTQIKVLSLPANGTLKLSDTSVTGNQVIPVGDLGNLTFEPDANWNGNTSFSWNGSDGTAYAASAANVDITIVPDAPTVSAISKSGIEDTPVTFSATDFTSHFTDPDGNSLTKIQVMSLPNYGVLKLSGNNISVDQEIVVGDLGDLTFEPDANWNGNTSFSWNGSDGTSYAASAADVNIKIWLLFYHRCSS
jgi:hypothetical protein